jgi:hypothetical protein
LASNSANPIASPKPTHVEVEVTNPQLATIVHVAATIHKGDLDAKGYVVPQPHIYTAGIPGDSDEDDDDASDGSRSSFEGKTFFLTRNRCAECAEPDGPSGFHGLPEYITWTDSKNVPDGCPICQKVLFKKGSQGSRSFDDDL